MTQPNKPMFVAARLDLAATSLDQYQFRDTARELREAAALLREYANVLYTMQRANDPTHGV